MLDYKSSSVVVSFHKLEVKINVNLNLSQQVFPLNQGDCIKMH